MTLSEIEGGAFGLDTTVGLPTVSVIVPCWELWPFCW
jgi:hypothetical protein